MSKVSYLSHGYRTVAEARADGSLSRAAESELSQVKRQGIELLLR